MFRLPDFCAMVDGAQFVRGGGMERPLVAASALEIPLPARVGPIPPPAPPSPWQLEQFSAKSVWPRVTSPAMGKLSLVDAVSSFAGCSSARTNTVPATSAKSTAGTTSNLVRLGTRRGRLQREAPVPSGGLGRTGGARPRPRTVGHHSPGPLGS